MDYEIIPMTGTPVTLERAKQHLHIEPDYDEEDDIIQGCIDGAVSDREAYLGRPMYEERVYYPETFTGFEFEAWADASATVQYSDGFDYVDLPAENFTFRKVGGSTCKIEFKGTLPELPAVTHPIKVNVTSTCPKAVISATLLVIGDLYERREDRPGSNERANDLCRPFKKFS